MIDFAQVKTYPIAERNNKFHLQDMIIPGTQSAFTDPRLDEIAAAIVQAREKGKKVIMMIGGAVVKVGCSAIIIDLIQKGFIHHIALNGGASIHDFELALIGETSEDVPNGLTDGSFGMAEETLSIMNAALNEGARENLGYGNAIACKIDELQLPHRDSTILYSAMKSDIPATVHIAIGGDIIHQHPSCDGAVLGQTSFQDFHIITDTISELVGGVLLNVGSAVNLPEVFLKGLTICRNLGYDVREFVSANFDFLDMYRPRTRIVEWPAVLDCRGYDLRGNHTETMPALYNKILEIAG